MPKSFVPGLEDLRRSRGLTRADMAQLLNVTYQSIYHWEHGICAPRLRTVIKMARAFGVTPNDLIQFEIDPRDTRAKHLREGVARYLS